MAQTTTPASVLIIGASLAGLRCATSLRRAGFSGSITLVGDEPHLPYDRPPLSKQVLSGEWDAARTILLTEEKRADLELDLRLAQRAGGLVVADRSITLESGQELDADVVVLATGARPRRLPGMKPMGGVHVLRTIDDATALHADLAGPTKNVVVIGAGFIGAEVAATAHGLGHRVSVVEAAAVPMERGLGQQIGAICGQLHVAAGVDLRLNTGVEAIEGGDAVTHVTLTDGSHVPADVVVVGVGVLPNVEWLEGSGLTLENGVVCNEFCEAAPGIYAVGDMARWPNRRFSGELMRVEHWENAVEQGSYVGRRIAGTGADAFAPVPWFWSDQYEHKIQLAGRPRSTDNVQIMTGSVEEHRFAAIYGRGNELTGVFGLNRPRHVMQFRRMIEEGVSWSDAIAAAGS